MSLMADTFIIIYYYYTPADELRFELCNAYRILQVYRSIQSNNNYVCMLRRHFERALSECTQRL